MGCVVVGWGMFKNVLDTYVDHPTPWVNERYLGVCASHGIFWYDGSHPFAKRFKYQIYGVSPEGVLEPKKFNKELLAMGEV